MLDTYLSQLNKSPNTKLAIRRDVGAFLRERNPLHATTKDVRFFFEREATRGLSPKALHERYRHLKEFFSWLVAAGLRQDNPMDDMPEPRAQGSLPTVLRVRNQAIAVLLQRGVPASTLVSLTMREVGPYQDSPTLIRYLALRERLQPKTDRVFVTQCGLPMTPSGIYWAGGRVAPARTGTSRMG